jgi:laminin alpha 1/2
MNLTNVSKLLQVYQVLHVRVRAGNSPRPGDWVLERSTDGSNFKPWQYFATSGEQCWAKYGLRPHHGHYPLKTDSEVLCTTAFSKVTPVDSGEVIVFYLCL